jgi:hypothetical protein
MLFNCPVYVTMSAQPEQDPTAEYIPNASDQYADIVTLYNTLALTTRQTTAYTSALQATNNTMLRTMSALFPTDAQKSAFSTQSRRFTGLTEVLAHKSTHILILEQWGN